MATRTTDGTARRGWARLPALLVAIGVPLALVGGLASCVASELGYLPGDSMERVWDAPRDRPAAEYGNAAWAVGDTVVRSRFDAVTAFDARSGKRRWEYTVPGRAEICTTSTAASDAVALIVLDDSREGCATVAAIDLKDGRELWRTGRRGPGGDVATGAGLAVILDTDERWDSEHAEGTGPVLRGDQALRAVDLRTGAPRWKAAVPKGCLPRGVAVAPERVLAALTCAGDEAELAAFAPADGRPRWTVPLGERRPVAADASVSFLSAEPTVLKVVEPTRHGVNAFLAFGQDGRRQGRIDAFGKHAAVADGKLLLTSGGGVVAFDLASGDEAWRAGSEDHRRSVTAMHAGGGRVTLLTRHSRDHDELYVFDSATGDTVDERTFSRGEDDGNGELTGLFRYEDLLVTARWGTGKRRPFSAYRGS
ncbi:PQQ-binding-like beta-propeller repeat protein [Streptomyces sp. NK15101]|uniref:outer membrane protein assembly factor BamB family protein n=1 Tax=Streptomyces sp. NK15101 TaxID=2873261 RepID=UPI001CEC59B0|nr:PQQ-binding-like beta-propeller repeat protein [Streptomyces sp. NK15101]